MKALILCAGMGTRLWPLTKEIPKPMVDINGKPCLERIVEHLKVNGITQIMVNLHYLPNKIMEHFGTELLYSYEPELLGEEGTIRSLARWLIGDYCVVMNGDTITNLKIQDMFSMSQGKNVKFMDGSTYAGTRIISPSYVLGDTESIGYHNFEATWFDIGTKEGLKKARNYYSKLKYLTELN